MVKPIYWPKWIGQSCQGCPFSERRAAGHVRRSHEKNPIKNPFPFQKILKLQGNPQPSVDVSMIFSEQHTSAKNQPPLTTTNITNHHFFENQRRFGRCRRRLPELHGQRIRTSRVGGFPTSREWLEPPSLQAFLFSSGGGGSSHGD